MRNGPLTMLAAGLAALVVPSLWAIDNAIARASLALAALVVVYLLGLFTERRASRDAPPSDDRSRPAERDDRE